MCHSNGSAIDETVRWVEAMGSAVEANNSKLHEGLNTYSYKNVPKENDGRVDGLNTAKHANYISSINLLQ